MRRLLFRSFRLVHRLDAWVRARLTSGGRLLVAGLLASGIFGVDVSKSFAFQVFGLCVALLVVAALGAFVSRPRCAVHRALPRFATVGEPLRYRAEIRNVGPRRQVGLLAREESAPWFPSYEEFRRAREPEEPSRNRFDRYVGYPRWSWLVRQRIGFRGDLQRLPPVEPGQTVEVELELLPLRRGYLRLSGMTLLQCDPLGLLHGVRRARAPGTTLVLPRTYALPRPQAILSGALRSAGILDARSSGGADAFRSVREYRSGDPLRHIDWRAWARLDEPMVKEFHDEHHGGLSVFLDSHGTPAPERFEAAVTVAGSLMRALQGAPPSELLLIGEGPPAAGRSGAGPGLQRAIEVEHALSLLALAAPTARDRLVDRSVVQRHAWAQAVVVVVPGWGESERRLVDWIRMAANGNVFVLAVEPERLPAGTAGAPCFSVRLQHVQEDLRRFCHEVSVRPRGGGRTGVRASA